MTTASTDHLWRHFTAAGAPQLVIERGEGCYIWDNEGNRYLDALSALYCVNIGYGPWPGITEAAQKQLDTLPFFTNWVGFATPPTSSASTATPFATGWTACANRPAAIPTTLSSAWSYGWP